ncbi:MAG: hypothetical protein EXR73_11375 [Myxococcales bacterium]|nr:hypothetical protein [Myxococcales bacterium]
MSKPAIDPSLFDLRLLERHIKRGLITRQDVEKMRKDLADATGKAKAIDAEAHGIGDDKYDANAT